MCLWDNADTLLIFQIKLLCEFYFQMDLLASSFYNDFIDPGDWPGFFPSGNSKTGLRKWRKELVSVNWYPYLYWPPFSRLEWPLLIIFEPYRLNRSPGQLWEWISPAPPIGIRNFPCVMCFDFLVSGSARDTDLPGVKVLNCHLIKMAILLLLSRIASPRHRFVPLKMVIIQVVFIPLFMKGRVQLSFPGGGFYQQALDVLKWKSSQPTAAFS